MALSRTNVTERPAFVGLATGLVAGSISAGAILAVGSRTQLLVSAETIALSVPIHLLLASLLGWTLGSLPDLRRHTRSSLAVSGVILSVLCWIVGPLTIAPLTKGSLPDWSAGSAALAFPALVTSVLLGAVVGLALTFARERLAIDLVDRPAERSQPTRVVVLGGGFGAVAAAKQLEQSLAHRSDVEITIVSESNSLLFTPMLAEVAGSALDARHISSPLRASCQRSNVMVSRVEGIDLEMKSVLLRDPRSTAITVLPYDHLVFALGSVPNYRDIPGLEMNAFTLKTLHDAARLRNHVIRQLERADAEPNASERARMLTFVVAGGGFAGSETIAELFDLVHGVLHTYRRIERDEVRFLLVHSGKRLLPEISEPLAGYAFRSLRERGIEIQLEDRVTLCGPQVVETKELGQLPAETVVWTAGNRPHPLLSGLGCVTDASGGLLADEWLRLQRHVNVWGVGDCARIPSQHEPSGLCAPTAQHAQRQGKVAGKNIAAVIQRKPLQRYDYQPKGTLVALGHRTAAAEILGCRFSGFTAWLMWRAVYWSKLPGLEKKLRVLIDWTVDLVFPRDTVLLDGEAPPQRPLTVIGGDASSSSPRSGF